MLVFMHAWKCMPSHWLLINWLAEKMGKGINFWPIFIFNSTLFFTLSRVIVLSWQIKKTKGKILEEIWSRQMRKNCRFFLFELNEKSIDCQFFFENWCKRNQISNEQKEEEIWYPFAFSRMYDVNHSRAHIDRSMNKIRRLFWGKKWCNRSERYTVTIQYWQRSKTFRDAS